MKLEAQIAVEIAAVPSTDLAIVKAPTSVTGLSFYPSKSYSSLSPVPSSLHLCKIEKEVFSLLIHEGSGERSLFKTHFRALNSLC